MGTTAGRPRLPATTRLVEGTSSWDAPALESWIERWADDLRAIGVGRHEPVGLWCPNGPRFVAAFLALRRVDASIVPVHPRSPPPEVQRILADAGARRVLTDAGAADAAPFGAIQTMRLPDPDGHLEGEHRAIDAPPLPGNVLLYTSGSEGTAKGVLLGEGALRWHARAAAPRIGSTPADRWLVTLPLAHIGGIAMLYRATELGGMLVFPPAPLPHDLDPLVRANDITHLSLVATSLQRWLDARAPEPAPASLDCVLVGGGPVPADALERAGAVGLPVRLTYGLTEACSQVATATAATPSGSVGHPLHGLEVRIEDEAGRPCLPGADGVICVRGPSLMLGYHGDPARTAAALRDGWLRTGDLGRRDSRGDLWIVGRSTRIIVTGGEKVDPAEVEAALERHPAVLEASVVAVPDPEWGEAVVAAVVLRPGSSVDGKALRDHCRRTLAPYKSPRRVEFVSHLPHTPTGKVQTSLVREALLHVVDSAKTKP